MNFQGRGGGFFGRGGNMNMMGGRGGMMGGGMMNQGGMMNRGLMNQGAGMNQGGGFMNQGMNQGGLLGNGGFMNRGGMNQGRMNLGGMMGDQGMNRMGGGPSQLVGQPMQQTSLLGTPVMRGGRGGSFGGFNNFQNRGDDGGFRGGRGNFNNRGGLGSRGRGYDRGRGGGGDRGRGRSTASVQGIKEEPKDSSEEKSEKMDVGKEEDKKPDIEIKTEKDADKKEEPIEKKPRMEESTPKSVDRKTTPVAGTPPKPLATSTPAGGLNKPPGGSMGSGPKPLINPQELKRITDNMKKEEDQRAMSNPPLQQTPPWDRKRPHPDNRQLPPVGGIQQKEEQQSGVQESMAVMLDDFNSDLHLRIDKDGLGGAPLTHPNGFCFCWAGARGTYGVQSGKVFFEVKITENLQVDFGDDHTEADPHVVRVGWSVDSHGFQLGEDPQSYGYGGTGRFSQDCKFARYGESFGDGDILTVMVDYVSRPPAIAFSKNGRWLGVAHKLTMPHPPLFPHVLSKNCRFRVNFGQEPAWTKTPPGFMFINKVPMSQRTRGMLAPSNIRDCEILMIVGLPGTGKTTWGMKMQAENPDKRYNIIGTDTLIDKMKVNGLPRKNNYHGRWEVLIQKATTSLNKLFEIGSKKHRNYVLDQTNVYASAKKKKVPTATLR